MFFEDTFEKCKKAKRKFKTPITGNLYEPFASHLDLATFYVRYI